MSSESYLKRLFKSHNWDKSINDLSDFVHNADGSTDNADNTTDSDLDELGIPATSVASVISSLQELSDSDTCPISPFQDVMNVSKIKPTSDPTGKTPSSIYVPESKKGSSGSTKPLAPMPPDCITKMYLEEGF